MNKSPHQQTPVTEEQLLALLATLRVEQTPEADFEGRFLSEFHERVAREAVCCPARRHLLAHVLQMLENIGRGRFAFGASALGIGLVALCFAMLPSDRTGMETTATVAQEKVAAPLMLPALSNDLVEYTTVRVLPGHSVFEVGGVTVTKGEHATIIEVPHNYIAPGRSNDVFRKGGRSALPASLPSSSVRYAF